MNSKVLQVLTVKPFFYLWLAEIFSQIAMNMINFILIILAFELTKSNTAVSGVVLSYTIPAIIFGVIAGVYVDRWNKHHVLFATNVIRLLLLLVLAVFHSSVVIIYILSFTVSLVTQFFIPAETPIIPQIVKRELLFSANAFFGMGVYGSALVAYALSGPFLIYFGNTWVFVVMSLFFLIAGIFILLIKVPKKKINTEIKDMPFLEEIKMVLALMFKTQAIYHSLFLLILSQILVLVLAVVGPGFASHVLHISVEQFPLLFVTPAALGMVVGGIILIKFFHDYSKSVLANAGILLSAIVLFSMPYADIHMSKMLVGGMNMFLPNFFTINYLAVIVFLAFLLGLANSLVFVPSNTLLQEETSDEVRGKIYGVLNALIGIFSLLPVIVAGGLADLFGVSSVFQGIGILLFFFFFVRIMQRTRRQYILEL